MVLSFLFRRDSIAKKVKEETSILAKRRAEYVSGGEMGGDMHNDLLIFDEEYETLFNRLFSEAHGELISRISSNY